MYFKKEYFVALYFSDNVYCVAADTLLESIKRKDRGNKNLEKKLSSSYYSMCNLMFFDLFFSILLLCCLLCCIILYNTTFVSIL